VKYIQQLNAIDMFGFLYFNFWDSTQVLKAMRESVSTKPAIFAMSNPTMNGLFVRLIQHSQLLMSMYFILIFLLLLVQLSALLLMHLIMLEKT